MSIRGYICLELILQTTEPITKVPFRYFGTFGTYISLFVEEKKSALLARVLFTLIFTVARF